jgi:hypothetical protein
MPSVTFQFVNATATNLPLLNLLPALGWTQTPDNPLPAHAIPNDAIYPATNTNLTISYGGVGGPYNAAYLAGAPPTVHTTANMNSNIVAVGGGDYRVTLTYL